MAGEEWRVERTESQFTQYWQDGPETFVHWRVVGPSLMLGNLTFATETMARNAARYLNRLTAANERADRYKAALENIQDNIITRNTKIRLTDFEVWISGQVRKALNPIPSSDTGENDG